MISILTYVFVFWTAIDRIISTFRQASFNPSSVHEIKKADKINSVLMIVVYVSIFFTGLIDFSRPQGNQGIPFLILGVILYLLARNVRLSVIGALGTNWNLHVSSGPTKRVLDVGPFRYSRHPYYSATVVELIAYAILFSSSICALGTLFIFIPLMLYRVLTEEKNMDDKFAQAYKSYKKRTSICFSLGKYLSDGRLIQDITQLTGIAKRLGFGQIAKIKLLGDSIATNSRGYAVSRIGGSLIELNVISDLKRAPINNLEDYCSEKHFDFETLKTCLDYFSILGILKKRALSYQLSSRGLKLFDDASGAFTLLYAYMPIFENLPDIIRKKKSYGKDVFRKDKFVGQGSAELAKLLPFPYSKEMLEERGLKRILDLGCGDGYFLLDFCEKGNFDGFGVDLSPETINVAEANARERNLASKVKFVACDARALSELPVEFKNIDAITISFVLHEFLGDLGGDSEDLLNKIREAFPDKPILISEVYRRNVDELIGSPSTVAEHHLFHRLSKQELATLDQWRKLFMRAGYECIEERRFDKAAQAYFLIAPTPKSCLV